MVILIGIKTKCKQILGVSYLKIKKNIETVENQMQPETSKAKRTTKINEQKILGRHCQTVKINKDIRRSKAGYYSIEKMNEIL